MANTNVGDTISRQAAINVVHSAVLDLFDFDEDDSESPFTYHDEQLLSLNKAITTKIKSLPSVERKKGKWIESGINYQCPFCHEEYDDIANWSGKRWRLCPMCGAYLK